MVDSGDRPLIGFDEKKFGTIGRAVGGPFVTGLSVVPSLRQRIREALKDGLVLAAKYGLALALILGGSWLFFVEYLGVRQNAVKGAAAYGYIAEQLAKQKAPEGK